MMKSYLSVENIEEYNVAGVNKKFAVCELENISITERANVLYVDDCYVLDVELSRFADIPRIGDIYSVIHENGEITEICGKEPDEKQRRIDEITRITNVVKR